MLDGLDAQVAAAFDRALAILGDAGATITTARFPVLDEIAGVNARGGFAAGEAYAWHRRLLAEKGEGYDPRIRKRILRGEGMSAAAYLDLIAARAELIRRFDASTAGYDALIMPTCPLVPPAIAALDDEDEYNRVNLLQLRNTSAGNFLDRCAISLPCERPGEAPVGLMLMGETLGDARLFAVAAAVEAALA
jgi:aspartyl-tRNA(Asn)/glutamyl-tRNA(Gln) amidotransferase subunit A